MTGPLFQSWLIGGFECSTHRRRDGRRLDVIAATRHDEFAAVDYRRLAELDMLTARDGLRWHLIEKTSGKFDFSSVSAQMDAAEQAGVQVIWDLFHYGYPDHVQIFSDDFPKRFAEFSFAFANYYAGRSPRPLYFVPVNEISFFAFMAGDIGRFFPFATDRGGEVKRCLVRAAIAAIDAVRSVIPEARSVMSEPAIHMDTRPEQPHLAIAAQAYRTAQYEAFDMISGDLEPELGGRPEHLDIIGINYYPHNQWFYPDREMIPLGDALYRPFADILEEIHNRYRRPMFISETGTEDEMRIPWIRYVASECEEATRRGVDLNGMCLYPILNHPGWEDERHCHNGLWDYCTDAGERVAYEPLRRELASIAEAHQAAARTSTGASAGEPAIMWA
jgi:beta-glucosidase/6-phospho-beta-glucosidase/beta-galactosidase